MPGWLRSAGSGPLTWMRSNATSTGWISRHQRKGRQGEDHAAQTANVTKEKRNENQTDQRIRGRPAAMFYTDDVKGDYERIKARGAHPAGTPLRAAVQEDGNPVGADGRALNGRRLYRLKPEPVQEVDAWLVPFRRFWSAHVDALKRHLD